MDDMQNESSDISFSSSVLNGLRLETPKNSQEDLTNSHKRKSSVIVEPTNYKRKFTSVTYSPTSDETFDILHEDSRASSSDDVDPLPLRRENSVKLTEWLDTFKTMSSTQQFDALNELIGVCSLPHIRFMRATIEPLLRRDFISLLPKEISMKILDLLPPSDLARSAQISHYWKKLAENVSLWKKKCQELGLKEMFPPSLRRLDGGWEASPLPAVVMDLSAESTSIARLNNEPLQNSCYSRCKFKALYLRHTRVMSNWKNKRFTATCQLRGHEEHVITCLQIKGDLIVTGSDDNTIRIWSAATATCIHQLFGHTGGVWTLQISDDGLTICSGATDRTVRIWSTVTGEQVHCLHGHTSTVRCMALHKNILVTGSRDCTLRVWNIQTGACLDQLYGHLAAVRCVQFDGNRIVSGGYDYKIIVNLSSFPKMYGMHKQDAKCTPWKVIRIESTLCSEKNLVVSGSLDTTIRVWDVVEGVCLHTLVGHTSLTSGMQILDNLLVSANADSTIKLWDLTSGHCIHTLDGHDSAVTSIQFLHGKLVASSSDDGTVKLWDVQKGTYICDLVKLPSSGAGGCVWRLKATPTMLVCAVGSRYGTEDTKLILLECDAPYP